MTLTARVQLVLLAQGYYTGQVDGLMGAMTSAAISRFQQDNDLTVNGQINADLLNSLGLKSVLVQRVQEALTQRGFYMGKIDGIESSGLQASIEVFQAANDLPGTGNIDAELLDALGILPL